MPGFPCGPICQVLLFVSSGRLCCSAFTDPPIDVEDGASAGTDNEAITVTSPNAFSDLLQLVTCVETGVDETVDCGGGGGGGGGGRCCRYRGSVACAVGTRGRSQDGGGGGGKYIG